MTRDQIHNPDCTWEKTTCVYKDTHYYCPHPEHTCTCINTPNNIAGEEWTEGWKKVCSTWCPPDWREEMIKHGEAFIHKTRYEAHQEGIDFALNKPGGLKFVVDQAVQEAIAGERERIVKELQRRSLKIEEMVSDERGLHLIVNPDEIEEGTAQLFTGDIISYLLTPSPDTSTK